MSKRPSYVLDATPIIHFAKISKLGLILSMCEAYMTREVYVETVERGKGKPDSITVRDAVERGELKIYETRDRTPVSRLLRHRELHLGETEMMAAAKELNAYAVIDEAEARAVAKTYGVKTRTGTLFLLFRLLLKGLIDRATCERLLDELVESGLYIDSQTLIRARRKIRGPG